MYLVEPARSMAGNVKMPQSIRQSDRTAYTAPVKWAQRSECLFITIDLHDVSNETVSFTETTLHFRGESEGKYFETNLELFRSIDPAGCKWKTHPLGVEIYVKKLGARKKKKGKKSGFWPHLLKDKALEKLSTVTVDWNHYIDSDEEEEKDTGFRWSSWG